MAGIVETVKNKIKGSLTVQVVGLCWCVLFLIFGINGLMVYRFTMSQKVLYFKQSAEYGAIDFTRIMEELMPADWLIHYWYEHPEALTLAQTKDKEAYQDVYDQLAKKYGDGWEFVLSSSLIKSMNQEEQEALSKYFYDDLEEYVDVSQEEFRDTIEGPFIAGRRAGELPRVLYCGSKEYYYPPGEVLNIREDKLEQLQSVRMKDGALTELKLPVRRSLSGTGGGEEALSGVGCGVPAGKDDLVMYVIMAVDEPFLKKQSAGVTLRMIGINVLISTLLGFALIYILNLLILRPVTRIQRGLHVYVENGDTDEVVKTMESVQGGNEIKHLAGDIGNMVQEMEEQVRARQQLEDEQEKIAAELENAARIQMAMLPNVFPDRSQDPRLELYATMAPAREVGGDLYDFFQVDQDNLALVIADVSGKGIPAALFMMEAKTLIREITHPEVPLEKIMERVNQRLYAFNEEQLFITTWMMIVNLSTGKALEVNAGHTKPVLCRFNGSCKLVRNIHDCPLGIMENLSFTVHEWQLEAGDRIFVYTDGIDEAENNFSELFGTDRLLDALNEKRQASQKETLAFVAERVRAFAGDKPQTDDITMLGMTYFGNHFSEEVRGDGLSETE